MITIFGEIEFSRRYYQEKSNEKEKANLIEQKAISFAGIKEAYAILNATKIVE